MNVDSKFTVNVAPGESVEQILPREIARVGMQLMLLGYRVTLWKSDDTFQMTIMVPGQSHAISSVAFDEEGYPIRHYASGVLDGMLAAITYYEWRELMKNNAPSVQNL